MKKAVIVSEERRNEIHYSLIRHKIGITYAEGPEEDQLESSAIDVRNMREFLTRRTHNPYQLPFIL